MTTEMLRNACRIVARNIIDNMIADLGKKQKDKRKGRMWVRKLIAHRHMLGASEMLLRELSTEDPESYRNHLRMTEKQFNVLLKCIGPCIQRQNTWKSDAIPAKVKLEITLRYLSSEIVLQHCSTCIEFLIVQY